MTKSFMDFGKKSVRLALALFHVTHKTSLMVSNFVPFSKAFRMLCLSTPNNFATPLLLTMDELDV
jgi:hypothetical protein